MPDLVARAHRHMGIEIAGRETAHAGGELAQRTEQRARQPRAGHDHHEEGDRPHDQEIPLEAINRREGLRGVDLGNERPLDPGNPDRPPRSQRRNPAIADDFADTLDATDCRPGRGRVGTLVKHGRTVSLDGGDFLLGCPPCLQLGEIEIGILEVVAAARANQEIRADKVGLAGGAEAFVAPAPAAGDDGVDLLDRQFGDEHTGHDALVDHRRRHEGRGETVRGQVGGEILQARRRRVGRGGTTGRRRRQIGVPIGTRPQRGGEIGILVDGVDQSPAPRVDDHEILEPQSGARRPQQRMVDRVELAVGAAVTGIVEQVPAALGMGILDDVEVLQKVRRGRHGQVFVRAHVLAEQLAHHRHVLGVVPPQHSLPHVGGDFLRVQLVHGLAEAARGVDDHLRGREQTDLVAHGAEVGLDLMGLGLARRGELREDRPLQRLARPDIAQDAGDHDRDRAQQQQDREQFCREAPADGPWLGDDLRHRGAPPIPSSLRRCRRS